MIWRLIKALFYLAVIAGLGLIAYAYLGPIFLPGDFHPVPEEIRAPVTLDLTD